MEDQLILFETAKLAKERGFDLECRGAYLDLTPYEDAAREEPTIYLYEQNHNKKGHRYSAPTQTALQKWLREKYNIEVLPYPIQFLKGKEEVECDEMDYHYKIIIKGITQSIVCREFATYEEAFEAGLINAFSLMEWKGIK